MSATMKSLSSIFLLIIWFPYLTSSSPTYQQLKLPSGVIGAESFAFGCNGEGPYTGVSDGRVLKWQGGWSEFAVTSPFRSKDLCDGSSDPNLEHICGRPLGLQFNKLTCDLYIADAYFGLMKVGKNGGKAVKLASSAEGVPFNFTNSLDIDQDSGVVYFTDSSTKYQRRDNLKVFITGDNTARFMKYDPHRNEVKVLLKGLKFANGVALSKDKNYVLVAETTNYRVLKYWLKGSRAKTVEALANKVEGAIGAPDNVKRNDKGEFWVGLNDGRKTPSKDGVIGVKVDGDGRVLETLNSDGLMNSVSEVAENKGKLLVGSVAMSCVLVSTS